MQYKIKYQQSFFYGCVKNTIPFYNKVFLQYVELPNTFN